MSNAYENYYSNYHKDAELHQNLKFKKKYEKLRRIVKDTVFVSFDIITLLQIIVIFQNVFFFVGENCLHLQLDIKSVLFS